MNELDEKTKAFAATIKKKHPDYADMDDGELARKVVTKYPEYSDMVAPDFAAPVVAPATPPKTDTRAQAVINAAKTLGIDPLDYATVISYESAGTFDPWKAGPVTKWGQHRGTIQYGEPQRKQYGVYKGQTFEDQVTNSNVKYLRDRGVRPGMDILQIYKAINGGNVNVADNVADINGTQVEHVARMMRDHRKAAAKFLGGNYNPNDLTPRSSVPVNPLLPQVEFQTGGAPTETTATPEEIAAFEKLYPGAIKPQSPIASPPPTNPVQSPMPTNNPLANGFERSPRPQYDFETTGKTADGKTYLGMRDGKYHFQNADGDEFVLDEASKTLQPTSKFAKKITLESGETLVRGEAVKNGQRYFDENKTSYIVTEDGKISVEKSDANYLSKQYFDYVVAARRRGDTDLITKEQFEAGLKDAAKVAVETSVKRSQPQSQAQNQPRTVQTVQTDAPNQQEVSAPSKFSTLAELDSKTEADRQDKIRRSLKPMKLLPFRVKDGASDDAAVREEVIRQVMGSNKFDVEAQDVESAWKKSPGYAEGDAKIDRSRPVEITLDESFLRSVYAAKEYRQKKEKIQKREQAGEIKGLDVLKAMRDEGLMSESQYLDAIARESGKYAAEERVKNEERAKISEWESRRSELTKDAEGNTVLRKRTGDEISKAVENRTKEILDDYGSFADYRKETEEYEKFDKAGGLIGGHAFGRPTEALKTAARYITKIPATILDTVAMSGDFNPLNLAADYIYGTDSKKTIDAMLTASEGWRTKVDKDLALKQNKVFKNDFIVNELSEGLAQFATQIILAPVTGGYSLALPLAEGSTAQYKEANKAGAGKATRLLAATVGGLAGVPDVILKAKYLQYLTPLEKTNFISTLTRGIFGRLALKYGKEEARELTKVTVSSFVKNAAFGFAGESGQEWSEDIVNDLVAKVTYKPKLDLTETFLPNEKKLRGYAAAGIAGMFGGTVETVTQKMTTDELLQANRGLSEMLADDRISRAYYENVNNLIQKELTKKGASLPNLMAQTRKPQISQTVKNFLEALPAEDKASADWSKAKSSVVGRKKSDQPTSDQILGIGQNEIAPENKTEKGETSEKPQPPTEVLESPTSLESNEVLPSSENELPVSETVEAKEEAAPETKPVVGSTVTAEIRGKSKTGEVTSVKPNKNGKDSTLIVEFEDGSKTFVSSKKAVVQGVSFDDETEKASSDKQTLESTDELPRLSMRDGELYNGENAALNVGNLWKDEELVARSNRSFRIGDKVKVTYSPYGDEVKTFDGEIETIYPSGSIIVTDEKGVRHSTGRANLDKTDPIKQPSNKIDEQISAIGAESNVESGLQSNEVAPKGEPILISHKRFQSWAKGDETAAEGLRRVTAKINDSGKRFDESEIESDFKKIANRFARRTGVKDADFAERLYKQFLATIGKPKAEKSAKPTIREIADESPNVLIVKPGASETATVKPTSYGGVIEGLQVEAKELKSYQGKTVEFERNGQKLKGIIGSAVNVPNGLLYQLEFRDGFARGQVFAKDATILNIKDETTPKTETPAKPKTNYADMVKQAFAEEFGTPPAAPVLSEKEQKAESIKRRLAALTGDTNVTLKRIEGEPEAEFNEKEYAGEWQPLLNDAADLFRDEVGDDKVMLIRRMMRQMNDWGFAKESIEKAQPYFVRFMEDAENSLQSETDESITNSEVEEDVDRNESETNDNRSDAGESTADVSGTRRKQQTESSAGTESEPSDGNVSPTGKRSESGSRDGKSGTDAASADAATPPPRRKRNSDSASDGIRYESDAEREQSTKRDYLAPVGSLQREGNWKETAVRNLDILELVRKLEAENREATSEEQALLVKFTGWGASELANNLFPGTRDNLANPEIKPEYARSGWKELAQRAKDIFTPEELKAALASTQNAHYTSEGIVRGIWSAVERMGFTGGNVLEPGMGVGLFAVAAPENIIGKSKYTGIERETFTARIARYLLPKQGIIEADYTRQNLPNDFFDAAIGNPPFADIRITDDRAYAKYRFMLHDYFFAKTIDKVRPGGLLVFVTSKGTMDKLNDRMRSYINERADLLGAIRLPQTAFGENAGTEVVTDVIFLQKREEGAEPAGEAWLGHGEVSGKNKWGDDKTGLVNEYFARHPEMVLGRHAFTGKMRHGQDEYTVEPTQGENLEEAFRAATEKLPVAVYQNKIAKTDGIIEKTIERDFNPKAKKEGKIYISDAGKLMRVEMGSGIPVTVNAKDEKWLRSYITLRDALKQAQYDQLNDTADWETSLAALNAEYDAFVKKHGNILAFTLKTKKRKGDDGAVIESEERDFINDKLLEQDTESPLVETLEKINEDGKIVKGKILLERTINSPRPPEITSVSTALAVSLDKLGSLNLAHVAELYSNALEPITTEQIIEELGDGLFELPGGGHQLSDEYLSGFVIDKLEAAEAAAATDGRFMRNVEALRKAQPKPLESRHITVSLGANWIPQELVNRFAVEVLEMKEEGGRWGEPTIPVVTYNSATNQWTVPLAEGKGSRNRRSAADTWGTAARSSYEILDAALNNRSLKVLTKDDDGKVYTDDESTAAVNEKAKAMRERFKTWIWEDAGRAKDLTTRYNRQFNNIAPRKFSGDHLSLPGLSALYTLHPHQKRVVWRVLQTGNTYLAHAVGAGKTLEMIVSGMEQRRLGLINKPMYVVPNHMLKQFSSEFLEAYPLANILVADEQNFYGQNRKRFVARAALSDLDAVVITHSAFGKIRTRPDSNRAVVSEMIGQMQALIDELGGEDAGGDRAAQRTVKQLQNRIERIERKFGGRTSGEGKDDVVDFEELGVDFLYVDEAHLFRKLDFVTNRTQVKGITPDGSDRSLDLLVKLRYLDTLRPGRSAVLASGTPITNTLAELYTIQRYLDPAELEASNHGHFDAWAQQFGAVVPGFEMNAAGRYEIVERFAEFINIPELMKRVRKFMDVLTMTELKDLLKVPTIQGGQAEVVIVPPTEETTKYLREELDQRIKDSRAWKPSFAQPNNPDPLIAIIGDGRLAAIDMRFINNKLPNNPDSKLNKMIDRIIEKYNESKDTVYFDKETKEPDAVKGATQIVFSAVGFGKQVAKNRGFDARAWMITRLTEAGIPRSEIAFMNDYKATEAKEAMFGEMRRGEKKILVGSPQNMGTGVNVQKRLKYLHFLSPPWYPADVEQPDGRIIRQGNQNDEVGIYRYATKGTYDSTAWSMIARKSKAIESAMMGDDDMRTLEDISESSQYEMASALAAGDERAIQLVGLTADIEYLKKLESAHREEQYTLRNNVTRNRSQINEAKENITRLNDAIKEIGQRVYADNFFAVVGGKRIDKLSEFGDAVKSVWSQATENVEKRLAKEKTHWATDSEPLKSIRVLDKFTLSVDASKSGHYLRVVVADKIHPSLYDTRVELKEIPLLDSVGLAKRVINALNEVASKKSEIESQKSELERQLRQAEAKIGAPFPQEAELYDKISERARLESEMAAENEDTTDGEDTDPNFKRTEATTEEFDNIKFARISELIEAATVEQTGSRIKVNLEMQEFLRRTIEEADIRSGKKKLGDDAVEASFSGLFQDRTQVKTLLNTLRSLEREAKFKGNEKASKFLAELADGIEAASDAGKGTIIAYMYDSRLPHEAFHQASYLGDIAGNLNNRHADAAGLLKHAAAQSARNYLLGFSEYQRLNETSPQAFDALVVEETAAYIAGGEAELLGIDENTAADYLVQFFDSYVEKNGIESLDNFEQVEGQTYEIVQKIKESFRAKSDIGNVGGGESLSENSELEPRAESRSDESALSDGQKTDESGNSRLAGQKLRSLPATLRESGIAASDALYDVQTDASAKEDALQMLNDLGIDGAIKMLKNVSDPDSSHANLAFMISQALQDHAAMAENSGNAEEAESLRELQGEFTADLARKFTKAGQFISAARVVANSATATVLSAQKIVQAIHGEDAGLSPEDLLKFQELGKQNEEAQVKLQNLSRELRNEKAKNKRLSDSIEGKTKRRTRASQMARKQLVTIVQEKHGGAVSALIDELRAKLSPNVPALKRIEGEPILKRIEGEGLDALTVDQIAQVGALYLTEGLAKKDAEYLPDEFRAAMTNLFGDAVKAQIDEIHLAALTVRAKWLKDIAFEKRKSSLQNKADSEAGKAALETEIGRELEDDLSDEDVYEILNIRADVRAKRNAIETIHRLTTDFKAEKAAKKERTGGVFDILSDLVKQKKADKKDADKAKRDEKTLNDLLTRAAGIHVRKLNSELDASIAEVASSPNSAAVAGLMGSGASKAEIYATLRKLNVEKKAIDKIFVEAADALERAKELVKKNHAAKLQKLLDGARIELDAQDALYKARTEAATKAQDIADELEVLQKSLPRYLFGQAIDLTNAMRTMMSTFDLSGALRQGGFFAIAQPESQKKAFANMLTSFGEKGYGRTVLEIEASPRFINAQRAGVEFAMAGTHEDLKAEEVFRGDEFIKSIPLFGKILDKAIVGWSERTYTAFLDTQRMAMYDIFADELESAGMTLKDNPREFEAIAKFINIATGKGYVPDNKLGRMITSLPFFAPRYMMSRFQLLNTTLNPVAYYNMPPGARKIVARSAVRFYGTIGVVMAMATALGAVSWDDDDTDFGKIKIGNTSYDLLVGALQPAKLIIKIVHSAYRTKLGQDNRIGNEFGRDLQQAGGRFIRGKLSPILSLGADAFVFGDTYVGEEFTWGKGIYSRVMPLIFSEMIQAAEVDGATGMLKTLPSFVGIGTSTFKRPAERATTEAEKLAQKAANKNFDSEPQTTDSKRKRRIFSELVFRSRSGENVLAETNAARAAGDIDEKQKNDILSAKNKTFLQDKAEGLQLKDLQAVYAEATLGEKRQLDKLMQTKTKNAQEKAEAELNPKNLAEKLNKASTDKAVELFDTFTDSMTEAQRAEFTAKLKEKADNASKRGTLTIEELESVRRVIPGYQPKTQPKPKPRPKRPDRTESLRGLY